MSLFSEIVSGVTTVADNVSKTVASVATDLSQGDLGGIVTSLTNALGLTSDEEEEEDEDTTTTEEEEEDAGTVAAAIDERERALAKRGRQSTVKNELTTANTRTTSLT